MLTRAFAYNTYKTRLSKAVLFRSTREARLHAARGVLLDDAAFRCLVDRLERLREARSVLRLPCILHRVLHGLRAAQVEHASAICDAVSFLGGRRICHCAILPRRAQVRKALS